jgi:hypothetical protein
MLFVIVLRNLRDNGEQLKHTHQSIAKLTANVQYNVILNDLTEFMKLN